MEEKELKVLKLDEITELIGTIFLVLFGIIAIISVINGYGIFRFIYTIGVVLVLFLPPILCVISGIILRSLWKHPGSILDSPSTENRIFFSEFLSVFVKPFGNKSYAPDS